MAGRALDEFLARYFLFVPHNHFFIAEQLVQQRRQLMAKLGAICARLNIQSKAMQIYNVDEVGISIVHKPRRERKETR